MLLIVVHTQSYSRRRKLCEVNTGKAVPTVRPPSVESIGQESDEDAGAGQVLFRSFNERDPRGGALQKKIAKVERPMNTDDLRATVGREAEVGVY